MIEYLLVAVIAVGNLGDYDLAIVSRHKNIKSCVKARDTETISWPRVRLICLPRDQN
jgi:hypothetical protein